jgi:hypothetical protein
MPFDIEGARQAGYTDAEIADHLSTQSKFDVAGARSAGYNDADIIKHLSSFDAPKPATANDRALAVSSGGYSGVAGMAGLPVDTALNVWDLGKAGVGAVQGMVTGKPPSDVFLPSDRSQAVGSSDWIKARMNQAGLQTQAPRPDDTASRVLHTGANIGTGMFLGSAIPTPTQVPVKPSADWTMPGYSARELARARASSGANANLNIGSGQAGAQAGVSGSLNASARGGGYNFGTVGDDAATGLTPGQSAARTNFPQGRLTPGQATGNKLLQRLEAKLESQPMTAGPFDRIKDSNAREVNASWARMIGERANNLSSEVLDRAATRIGGVFDDAADDAPRAIDPQRFLQTFTQIQDDVRGLVKGFGSHELVDDLTRLASNGEATGRQLQSLTSKLGKSAYKNMTTPNGDRDLGLALYRVKDYVDDLLMQGMNPDRLQRFQNAREQYRNLMLLTSRVGAVNPSTGNVNGSVLANALQQKDRAGFLFGRNNSEGYDAAHFAQAFRPLVGDSGTATRMPLPSPTDFVLSLPFNLATRAYTSSPAVNAAVRAQSAADAVAPVLAPVAERMPPMFSRGGLLGGTASADDLLWNR